MNKWIARIIILAIYCVPFAFLSINGDAKSGTMLFYGLMIIGFGFLCCGALKTNNVPIIYIGNGLSFISSYLVSKITGLEPMEYYFKPFTSHSLIVEISITVVIFQTIPVLVHWARKKKTQQ